MTRILLTSIVLLISACTSTTTPPLLDQKWTWSVERLEKAVNQVRAGRDLTPKTWPNGAKAAVLLSFDVDNETIAWWEGEPTISDLSRGEFGSRVALKRIVDLLLARNVPASFFIPALSLHLAPQMADEIKRLPRHEFAVHGWIHERNTQVPADKEREMILNAHKMLTELTGETPVGYRAPSWNFSPATPQIIQDMKFIYESSMMSDDRPYELVVGGKPTGIVELPVEWILDDAPLLDPRGDRYTNPREWLQVQKDEFDIAYQEGTMFLLTMHPHYIGHRSRIVVLEELITYIQLKDKVWFGTHREAAEYVRAEAGMK